MATKGSSENIPTSDKQDEVRRNAKKPAPPSPGTSQDGNHADQQSVFAEGRERQVAAIRRALPSGVSDNQRMFLEAMLSVYAELRRSDLMVNGKRLTMIAVTFSRISDDLGDELLKKFRKDWSSAKDTFYRLEKQHPVSRYCSQVQAERDRMEREAGEHLTQSLGALINPELVGV